MGPHRRPCLRPWTRLDLRIRKAGSLVGVYTRYFLLRWMAGMGTGYSMRLKHEQRHQAILAAAAHEFQRKGFEHALMEDIAIRANCSKVTLYAYFNSKEQLFFEAFVAATQEQFGDLYALMQNTALPAQAVLQHFGERFIALSCSSEVMALRRLALSASLHAGSDKRAATYVDGPKLAVLVCAEYLAKVHERGELHIPDPKLASLQLRALLEAEWLDLLLYGFAGTASEQRIHDSAERAVGAFFAMYGPVAEHTVHAD